MFCLLKQMMVDKQQQGIGSIANICYIGFVGDGCSGGGGGCGSSSGRGTNSSGILQSVKLDRLAWAWLQQRKQTIA